MEIGEREFLNTRRCKAPPTNDEASHFMVCPTCGQAFDCRKLGDVFYHDEPDHVALPVN